MERVSGRDEGVGRVSGRVEGWREGVGGMRGGGESQQQVFSCQIRCWSHHFSQSKSTY